jgi:hypothetical protein
MKNTDDSDDNGKLGAIRQFQFPECTDLRTGVKRSGFEWLDLWVDAASMPYSGFQCIGAIGKVSPQSGNSVWQCS